MNNRLFILAFLLLQFGFSQQGLAQSKSFENIFETKLKNTVPIFFGDEVKGYAMFYDVDKVTLFETRFLLRILDENLNMVLEKELVGDRDLNPKEAVMNDSLTIIKFFNSEKRQYQLLTLNKKGEINFKEKTDTKVTTLPYLDFPFVSAYYINKSLHQIGDIGFLDFTMGKKENFILHFISTDPNKKDWTYISNRDRTEGAELLAIKGDTVFCFSFTGRGSWAISSFVSGFDMNTGALLFKKEFTDNKVGVSPLQFWVNPSDNAISLIGYYHPKKAMKVMPFLARSSEDYGFLYATVGPDGNLLDKKEFSFKNEKFQELSLKTEKGRQLSVCFHNFIQTANGQFFLVGESLDYNFKRRYNDLIIYRLNENFELEDVKILEKNEYLFSGGSNPELFSNIGDWNISNSFKWLGFDYSFTVKDKNNSDFIIGYLSDESHDNSTKKHRENAWVFGALSHIDGQYSTDRMEIKSGADDVTALPAKFGYVCLLEYFKEEKKIGLRLEKINY